MNRICFLFLCLFTLTASANVTPTTEDIENMDLRLTIDEPSMTQRNQFSVFDNDEFTFEEPEKYYTNFLGEKCIDFGDEQPYCNWKRDVTYAGIPIFLSSFLIKSQKKAFRSARHTFEKSFKSKIDNYTQFAPYFAIAGMKVAGYEGRSSWDRFIVSTLMSNAVMATFVNATKYSVKEMRPDNSTRNSFPSGHTATAFTAATILHKEYGLTRSPWFSVGGYAVATGTGIMRVLNNRHWISDVVAGAGIGIMSTELGYFIGDVIYGNKGICRREQTVFTDPEHPSFFDIQMGVAMHSGRIDFEYEDGFESDYIQLGTSTAFGVEGAYFLNKYFGVGGMARITTTPGKGLNLDDDVLQAMDDVNEELTSLTYYNAEMGKEMPLPGTFNIYVDNNNFIDASLDVGVYGNLPLKYNLSLGAKLLVGARLCSGFSYKARNGVPKTAGTYTLNNGETGKLYYFESPDGVDFISSDFLDPGISRTYNFVLEDATEEYDIMKVDGTDNFNFVAGISLSWHYKDNFAWKVFADFDTAKNRYTYQGQFYSDEALARVASSDFPDKYPDDFESLKEKVTGYANKRINFLTLGAAFSVNF